MLSLWANIVHKAGAAKVCNSLKLAGRLTSAIYHLTSSVVWLSLLLVDYLRLRSCSCHAWPFNIYTASQKRISTCNNSLVGESRSVRILSRSIPSNTWSALIDISALSASVAQSFSVFLILLRVDQLIDLLPSIWIALPFELLRGDRRLGASSRWKWRSWERIDAFSFTVSAGPKAAAISSIITLLRELAGDSQDKGRYSHYCNNEADLLRRSWISNKNRIVSNSNGYLLLSVYVWIFSWEVNDDQPNRDNEAQNEAIQKHYLLLHLSNKFVYRAKFKFDWMHFAFCAIIP